MVPAGDFVARTFAFPGDVDDRSMLAERHALTLGAIWQSSMRGNGPEHPWLMSRHPHRQLTMPMKPPLSRCLLISRLQACGTVHVHCELSTLRYTVTPNCASSLLAYHGHCLLYARAVMTLSSPACNEPASHIMKLPPGSTVTLPAALWEPAFLGCAEINSRPCAVRGVS